MNGSREAQRRARRWLVVALALSLIAVACGGRDAGNPAGTVPSGPPRAEVDDGGELPSTELETADGTGVGLTDLLRRPAAGRELLRLLVRPCRAEMPDFAAVRGEVGDRVGFLGLAMQDTRDAAAELVELTGIAFPWGLDRNGEIFAGLRGFAMPTTVYVATDGEVVGTDSGAIDEARLRGRLADLFGVPA